MYIIFGILIFGLLIGLHELGHFISAKAFNVQVNEFALGMGPAIYKHKFGETLFSLRCLPFGGFCEMEGEKDDTENLRSFQKRKAWQKVNLTIA